MRRGDTQKERGVRRRVASEVRAWDGCAGGTRCLVHYGGGRGCASEREGRLGSQCQRVHATFDRLVDRFELLFELLILVVEPN
ncbi:hypothetical protein Rcae01_01065 [Novipirellula caenicola]|uniref:Uncharacterized protein n=1 Tax=Novipirellula caenicola TaxID=1536901 RepID=A0ABP9VK89_9BACT